MFARAASHILNVIFPPICPACGRAMARRDQFLCLDCQGKMPLTELENVADNPVASLFWGLLPLRAATAFMWYGDGAHTSGDDAGSDDGQADFRAIVHRFKYSGRWWLARELGRFFGAALAAVDGFSGVDLIVPVPLHPLKKLRRGYNQSDWIADGMSREMGVPVDSRAVFRHVNNRSQTSLADHSQRWKNVEGIFTVRHPERLRGRHILLVDDVLTTGATIFSLADAILRAAPDCRISVAALYASRKMVSG